MNTETTRPKSIRSLRKEKLKALERMPYAEVMHALSAAYEGTRQSFLKSPDENPFEWMNDHYLIDTLTHLFEVHLNVAMHRAGVPGREGYVTALLMWNRGAVTEEQKQPPDENIPTNSSIESNIHRRAFIERCDDASASAVLNGAA